MKADEIQLSEPRPLDEIMALGEIIVQFKTKEMELEFCRFMQIMTNPPILINRITKEPKNEPTIFTRTNSTSGA